LVVENVSKQDQADREKRQIFDECLIMGEALQFFDS
jgi:hypothetical protein